jgi:hypothetical protein
MRHSDSMTLRRIPEGESLAVSFSGRQRWWSARQCETARPAASR